MTPAQLRGARALLDWRQDTLADLAQVSRQTVLDFESGKRTPIRSVTAAIVRALESAGIQFGDDGSVRLGSTRQ